MVLRIDVDREQIARIARSHDVLRLRVFGSAVSDDFDAFQSDIDLLVDFAEDAGDRFEAYFGLKEDLERAFARPVDLVMSNAIHNPYFSARVLATAEELYAA